MPTVLDFQRLRDTVLPEWTKPENASVFDPAYRAPIRKIISLLGLDDPQQVMVLGTPLETGSMAGGAVEAISKRFPRFAQALKVYHGSPHDFERFDASKIGTGEGAQAYGHGLYFAENPDVARTYQGKVSAMQGGKPTIDGRPINWDNPIETAAYESWRHGGNRTEAAKFHEQAFAKDSPVPAILRSETPLPKIDSPGKTYEVAIHADPEHFLDWDKPLSQQSEYVKNKLKFLGFRPDQRDAQVTGEMAHEMMMVPRTTRGNAVAAGEHLKSSGIPGIKYLDQGSRAVGEGSRNFVVFPGNEHLIDILKKYGIAATTGVGIAGGLNANE